MTNPDGKTSFSLHIEGGTQSGDAVPAAVLAQILSNSQRAFELIGTYVEGRTIRERARISPATRSRFQLVCRLPEPGCYAVPLELGGTDLLAEHVTAALDVFHKMIEGITRRDTAQIGAALPDQGLRHRVLEAIRGMSPRADDKWRLKLWDASNVEFGELNTDSGTIIRDAIVPVAERAASQVVTGQLTNINFTHRVVTIFYPPTKREMECVELDLSPITVDTVKIGAGVLKARQGVTLEPATDETQQLICVADAALGIDAFARTREALVSELNEQIGMLWQEYALADNDSLDGEAIKMKQSLLAAFSEVANGA
ncbi:MAG: hypothetical protein HY777_06590 [Betaproteobacteria bacterium]|nr:hypothetical protein [Betaproteobacteria bacterium]